MTPEEVRAINLRELTEKLAVSLVGNEFMKGMDSDDTALYAYETAKKIMELAPYPIEKGD